MKKGLLFVFFAMMIARVYGSDWESYCFSGTPYDYGYREDYWNGGGMCVIKAILPDGRETYYGSVGCEEYMYYRWDVERRAICCLRCPQDVGPITEYPTYCFWGDGCFDTAGCSGGSILFGDDVRDQKEEVCGNGIDDNCNGETDENCKCDPKKGDQDCCERGQGDEVDIISGRMYLDQRIPIVLEGLGPVIEFRYGYSEGRAIWMQKNSEFSDMGYGWYHSYMDRLVFGSEYISLVRGDGVVEGFRKEINGYLVPTGKYYRLIEGDGYYDVVEPDGSYSRYDGGDGRLLSKSDNKGNEIIFSYYGIDNGVEGCEAGIYGKLCKVSGIDGRWMRYEYNSGGYLIGVTISGNNSLTLNYEYGKLVSIGDEIGILENYEYQWIDTDMDDIVDAEVLSVVKDSNQMIKEFWEYDGKGRAVRDWRVETDLYIDYDPDDNPDTVDGTIVYDAKNNKTIHYSYHLFRITRADGGDICGGQREFDWSYDGVMKLMNYEKDGEGRKREYTYDKRGNILTEKIKADYGNSNNYQLMRYTYHPEYNIRLSEQKELSVINPESGEFIGTIYDYDNDYDDEYNENPQKLLTQEIRFGYTYSDTSGSLVYTMQRTRYYYDNYGRIIRIDGPREDVNDEVIYEYYPSGSGYNSYRLWRVNKGGEITEYQNYNFLGKPEKVINADGSIVEYIYDIRGRLVQTRLYNDTEVEITENYYDNENRLLYTRMPEGNYIVYEYYTDSENNGRLKSVSKSSSYPSYVFSEKVEYEYYPNGLKKSEVYKDGGNNIKRKISYEYDFEGRLRKVYTYTEDADTPQYLRENFYDNSGNLIRVADENNAVIGANNFGNANRINYYDELNRIVRVSQRLGSNFVDTYYNYNKNGDLVEVIDGNGNHTNYLFDDFGRLVKVISPDSGVTVYVYDSAGNMIGKRDANNNVVSYQYDENNRLTFMNFGDASENITYQYGSGVCCAGRLVSVNDPSGITTFAYDKAGRILEEERIQDGKTFRTKYRYNRNGDIKEIEYPSGRKVRYEYKVSDLDKVGRVKLKNGVEEKVIVDDIEYEPYIGIRSYRYGNNIVTVLNRDLSGHIRDIVAGNVINRSYTRDGVGNILSITNNLDTNKSQSFTYDDFYRLTGATGIYGTQNFNYDNVGNRTVAYNGIYSYQSGTNRLMSVVGADNLNFSYDNNGNVITENNKEYVYNRNERLVRFKRDGQIVSEYTYDYQNRMTKREVNGRVIYYVYDLTGQMIGEYDDNGSSISEYFYLGSERVAKVDSGRFYEFSEGFESGIPDLRSYKDPRNIVEDLYPDVSLSSTEKYEGSYSIRLDGNTWKTMKLREILRTGPGSKIYFAEKVVDIGELQGIGFGDGKRQILYILHGTQTGWNDSWVDYRYFNIRPINQWNEYEINIGADFYNKYGYYPDITEIYLINDNDSGSGVIYFDRIRGSDIEVLRESKYSIRNVEDFESGGVNLTSYIDPRPNVPQDNNPVYSVTNETAISGSYSLYLGGNTWKTESISPVVTDENTYLRFAMMVRGDGEIQGIGFGDGSGRELIYSINGTQNLSSMNWFNEEYESYVELNKWHYYEVPVGRDWYAKYGYYPVITEIDYINDNDETYSGEITEGFENGINLVSYVDPRPGVVQDMGGTAILFTGDKFDGNISLKMEGNTWKTENVSAIRLNRGSVLRVAIKVPLKGELQGIGIGDNQRQLLYITQGTQYGWNAEWVSYRYFNTMPANQWNVYEIPIGADWYAKYGYYPEINKIHFINDNDACNGVVLFDAISITTRGGEVYFDDISFVEKEYISSTTDKLYYYHNDHLGTPQVLTDENEQIAWYGDYEPFGKVNILVERTTNNFRFPGQYFIEETGLYYNWNRNYLYKTGRYIEIDRFIDKMIIERGGIIVLNLFLYDYSMSNPIRYTDKEGLQSRDDIIKCMGEADRCYYGCFFRCSYNLLTCIKDSYACFRCWKGKFWRWRICYKICSLGGWSCYWAEECIYECEKYCDKKMKECLCLK